MTDADIAHRFMTLQFKASVWGLDLIPTTYPEWVNPRYTFCLYTTGINGTKLIETTSLDEIQTLVDATMNRKKQEEATARANQPTPTH